MSPRDRWWLREGSTPWAPEAEAPPQPTPVPAAARVPPPGTRPPGLDFVGRRLVGVLLLTPALMGLGVLRTLAYGLQLTFQPAQARERLFRLADPWRRAARFAWYEDFGLPHGLTAGVTAGGYWLLWVVLTPGG